MELQPFLHGCPVGATPVLGELATVRGLGSALILAVGGGYQAVQRRLLLQESFRVRHRRRLPPFICARLVAETSVPTPADETYSISDIEDDQVLAFILELIERMSVYRSAQF